MISQMGQTMFAGLPGGSSEGDPGVFGPVVAVLMWLFVAGVIAALVMTMFWATADVRL